VRVDDWGRSPAVEPSSSALLDNGDSRSKRPPPQIRFSFCGTATNAELLSGTCAGRLTASNLYLNSSKLASQLILAPGPTRWFLLIGNSA